MKTYTELKKSQSEDINNFEGLFFAFNTKQLKEGMEKCGITETSSIVAIGAGGYMRKDRLQAFEDMLDRHEQELKELKKNEKALLTALVYELQNHEFCITGDPTDALSVLNLTKEEVPKELLRKAMRLAV